MTLTYRGQSYTPCYTPIEATKVPLFGTYRGRSCCFSAPQSAKPVAEELTYRGITYNTRPAQQVTDSRQAIQLYRDRQHPAFGN